MNCIKKFSRIVCVSLFSYQGCFAVISLRQLVYFTSSYFVCQELFKFFSKLFLMKFFVFVDDLSTLSQVGSFVNHFFNFFKFKIQKKLKNGEGGI